ncbi:TPA: hypothetical protein EYP66_09990 [Candidatus Poribacteria bacterium]|nr:hypothetical protein [Candidatus Poribacteria bacterium]
MDLRQLKEYINKFAANLQNGDRKLLEARLESLTSVFPFNEYEYMLMFLRDRRIINFEEYEKLRDNYVKTNKYLELYGLAPRIFGQIWGEEHIKDLDTRFQKADKSFDPKYSGQYDIWIKGVRLEVKACRAIHTKKRGSLVSKALRYDSGEPFWMNFQQLKPDHCDGFVFIGVWVDQIVYWVMSSKQAKKSKYISHQHRGGIEYQIGITDKNIVDFEKYKVAVSKLADTILQKLKKK